MKNRSSVLVIGAGLSGLLAARELSAAGVSAVVVEKSRGVGGRMATRRLDVGVCDHGAQFFTVKSEDFRPIVDAASADGAAAGWCDGFPDGAGVFAPARHPRLRRVVRPARGAALPWKPGHGRNGLTERRRGA